MKLLSKISLLAIGLCLVLSLQAQTNDQLPPKREFRAAWLTTVWAIDWPNPHNASNASQQQKQKESLYALGAPDPKFFQNTGPSQKRQWLCT